MNESLVEARSHGEIVVLTLNRPEQHNALDSQLIQALHAAITRLAHDDSCRVLLVTGAGKSFCAGADLSDMRRLGAGPRAANAAEARLLANLLLSLHECPKPSIALVNGAAIGGGIGLVAACDIALAADVASFRFAEARLGLLPAVISPYVCDAIGVRAARALAFSGERFDAAEAHRLGLVQRVVPRVALGHVGLDLAQSILQAGPHACASVKSLIAQVAGRRIDSSLALSTAELLATLRAGAEAQEGLAAAIEKRAPAWAKRPPA